MERNIACENSPILLVNNENIRIRGRHTVVDQCLAFDWTNSGFAFAFSGTGFIINLGEYKDEAIAYIKVIVDGTRRQRFAVINGNEKLIIEGLTDKRHRVEVLKVTESNTPVLFKSIVLFGVDATLKNPPFNSPRRIEFIGDSITAGYGVLANHTEAAYNTYQQDGTYSYAYLTAERFGADARYICVSGKGIACNCEGNYQDVKTGEYYNRQTRLGGVCDDGWEPQVVVLNIGTNDCCGNAKPDEFSAAAEDILTKLRTRYNNAEIIWVYGVMTHGLGEIIREVVRRRSETDKKVHFIFADSIDGNISEIGAAGHPNVRASIRVSSVVAKKIRSITGWRNALKNEESIGE